MLIKNRWNSKWYENWYWAYVHLLLDKENNDPIKHFSTVECEIKAWITYNRHLHKETEEAYYILSWNAIMEINWKENNVTVWDCICIPKNKAHSIKAISDIRILAICSPARDANDTYYE